MKSTGIVRKVDDLGRVVIPMELRRTLEIKERDPLEIYVDSDQIILKKYEASEEKKQLLINLNWLKESSISTAAKNKIEEVIAYLEK
ncbi:AbrB/MazE/SpoVT family DNA-binding domain-containing protein [Halobacillus naozhouensis]|uniref:AbrB/MazE/SpoVT family DNA-binding domain-containing protein n=1 Tax=Halobacillus naozhouensis TaxID=554880 RepID=A0ABY8J3P9_9BACI|nr:AbrB/MazE/SpoVT family DNA-binding domain-containing protein [Halobacillus naozhouensis]WFT76212.1 AbrB/MazE/SpoVT family DNA-binding domain-containing protein [Halobacillus naozhouensis]